MEDELTDDEQLEIMKSLLDLLESGVIDVDTGELIDDDERQR